MKFKKVYVYYYEWDSTRGNHAGMAYFFRQLKLKFEHQIVLIKEPSYAKSNDSYKKYITKSCWLFSHYLKILFIRSQHELFFTEYGGIGWQTSLLTFAKFIRPKLNVLALVHLPYEILLEYYQNETTVKSVFEKPDKLIVFGSSLKNDLQQIGINSPIIRTYHYVDSIYSSRKQIFNGKKGRLKLIVLGSWMRNFDLLYSIIEEADQNSFEFHICRADHSRFNRFSNVKTYNYLDEGQLIELLSKMDVSLNVLQDTVGSNAITISLATGLPLIVSDVGSIRDYADESCAIFCCNTVESFVQALFTLRNDSERTTQMSKKALMKSADFSINNSLVFFSELL